MDREQAVKIIKECKEKSFKRTFYTLNEYYEAVDMAIKALEQEPCEDAISRKAVLEMATSYNTDGWDMYTPLVVDVEDIEELPSVIPQGSRWIPVGERLPENRNQEVLISLEWGIDIGRYSDGEWHSEWINHYDGNVLAWMPLPQPYKGESEDEE